MASLDDLSLDQLQALYAQKTDPHVAAIHSIESGGAAATANPVNPASGARSSMQTMPATARDPGFGVKPSKGTPVDDTRTGVQYYQTMLQRYGDPVKAAVAYDWGPGNADTWIAKGGHLDDLPLETLQYIQKFDRKTGALTRPAPPQPEQQAEAPAASPQAPALSMTDKVIRQLGLTARAAGHGLANAAGVIGNPVNATINSAGRALGFDPGMRTDLDQMVKQTVDANTPQPQGGLENAVQDVGAAVANPLTYAIPGGGATTITGAAARGIGQGVATTAANAPVQPGTTPLEYGKQLAAGGAAGGALGMAGGTIGRVIAGANLSPEARSMLQKKVTLTPGQAVGGHVREIENAMGGTVPIVGQEIKNAQTAAFSDMNRAVYSEILAPVGGQVPKEVGRDAIASIHSQLGTKLDDVLAQTSLRADQGYMLEMAPVSRAAARMPAEWRDKFNRILNDNIKSRTQQGGTLTGEDVQKATSALAEEAETLGGDRNAFAQELLKYVNATQAAIRNALLRQNPQQAQELNALHRAYANYAIARKAAANVKEDGMPFSPAQLSNAVKAKNSTVDKGGYAKGQALMQGISDAAQKTMGNTMPNSGTPGRQAVMHALGGGGIVAAMMTNPHLLIPPAILTGLYGTNAGRQAMLSAIARRPELARQLGNGMVNSGGQIGGILGGGYEAGQKR